MASLLDESTTWAEFGRRHLDPRVAKALTWTLKLERPTLVQSQGIPVALEGKDLLCRARTGSGKTLCYAVPMIQRLLTAAEAKGSANPMGGIVLVPTKELVVQVHSVFTQLLAFCFDVLTVELLVAGQEYGKAELPSIVVTTPSSLVSLVRQRRGTMQPLSESLKVLVVDEADLMFSFGYEDDMKEMCALLPATYQAMLVSATLSAEVEQLKGLMLHKPVLLKLEEPRVTGKLSQFYFVCKKGDKYLILYTLLKLQLVQGKKLIFVKNVENAYKLKILLERFSITSAVLNAQLPHKSRQNIIESFNQSLIDLLIATDAGVGATGLADEKEPEAEEEEEVQEPEEAPEGKKKKRKLKRKQAEEAEGELAEEGEATPRKKKKRRREKPGEAGGGEGAAHDEPPAEEESAGRAKKQKGKRPKTKAEEQEEDGDGADDINIAGDSGVAAVAVVKRPEKKAVQFGQRKGREADEHYSLTRGVDLKGVSTVINADVPTTVRDYVHRVGRCARGGASGTALTLCDEDEHGVLEKIIESQAAANAMSELKPLPMHVGDAERFRYRVEDQSYRLGKKQIVRYMARELQLEALHSEKLQEYFEANPDDKKALQRAQRQLRESKSVLSHLKSIPTYLVPDTFAAATPVQQAIRQDEAVQAGHSANGKRKIMMKRNDPLQTFETGSARKDRKPWLTRAAMIEKDRKIDPLQADPENLPTFSRKKLWALRHNKRVRNPKFHTPGERWREDHKVIQRRKKFDSGVHA